MPFVMPRVEAIPEPDNQVSFRVDGSEKLRWHAAERYPRPFFYPLIGPSGRSLTRIGHPAAPDHDHHRSVWFAHQNLAGNDFWIEGQLTRLRQRQWVHYQDGEDEAIMVVDLGWFDAHNAPLMDQRLIVGLRPLENGEFLFELQSTFSTRIDPLKLEKTNFGFLAVRVAKSISKHYGGGELRSSNGNVGEPAIFGREAIWVDYSGPIVGDTIEGITYIPHLRNPDYPSRWHVRDDGWMSAAFTGRESYSLTPRQPLTLRYLLYIHAGPGDPGAIHKQVETFHALPPYCERRVSSPWRIRVERS